MFGFAFILIQQLGNLIGWAPRFISLGSELDDGKYALFLVDYLKGATGQAGRDGLVLESFMYAQHAMAGLAAAINAVESYYTEHVPVQGELFPSAIKILTLMLIITN